MTIQNTVFISYRRTNSFTALAVYQELNKHGYDVFFDYNSIDSGDFEQIILGNIKSRAHFIVILTPSALERCEEPNDWLRREIETALDEKRNIVPLMFEGFDYNSPSIGKYLTGKLALLKNYNAQRVPVDFFEEAMAKVRTRFLSISLDAVIHPLSTIAQIATDKAQIQADKEGDVVISALNAEEWFEQAYKYAEANAYDEALRCYSEAIRLKPDFDIAFLHRGLMHGVQGDNEGAIADFNKAIRLKPDFAEVYYSRGIVRGEQGDNEGAMADYTEAIRLKPDFDTAFLRRGILHYAKGDNEGAMTDYTEAIRHKPDFALAYYSRGLVYEGKDDNERAIADYTEAIRHKPDFADAYNNRGIAHEAKDNNERAIADSTEAIRLKPDFALAYYNRGIVREKNGDIEGAIADYTEAIRHKPDYAEVYNNRAWAYYLKRNYSLALIDVNKSLALLSQDAYALHTRGAIQLALGNVRLAIVDFEAALAINPTLQDAIDDLAKAKNQLGK